MDRRRRDGLHKKIQTSSERVNIMSSDDFGNSGYQQNQSSDQGGVQDTPPASYAPPGQFNYQPTPTGQQTYGNNRMWGAAGTSGPGLGGGGLGRLVLGVLAGPGSFRRRGRSRYFWYFRIAFWLIVVGVSLYFGFTKHSWITTCTGDCGGGD
jgi:hypothetical protein